VIEIVLKDGWRELLPSGGPALQPLRLIY